jgi:hypothetical protein
MISRARSGGDSVQDREDVAQDVALVHVAATVDVGEIVAPVLAHRVAAGGRADRVGEAGVGAMRVPDSLEELAVVGAGLRPEQEVDLAAEQCGSRQVRLGVAREDLRHP